MRAFAGRLVVIGLLAVSGVRCAREVGPVPAAELVGRWFISPAAASVLAKRGFARTGEDDHEIVLRASGGCEFRSYWYSTTAAKTRKPTT
jgi:hypothetical protein